MTTRRVHEAMVRAPLVRGRSTTVEEALSFFASDHVHMLLLTDTGRLGEPLLGTIVRDDLPTSAPAGTSAMTCSHLAGRTVRDQEPLDEARRALHAAGQRRLAVLDDDGRLVGLLCLKRDGTGFCTDTDVESRRADRTDVADRDERPERPDRSESGPPGGLVEVLRRWEGSGGCWKVLGSTDGWIDVGLFTCDGAEQMGRVSSARTSVLHSYLAGRTSSDD